MPEHSITAHLLCRRHGRLRLGQQFRADHLPLIEGGDTRAHRDPDPLSADDEGVPANDPEHLVRDAQCLRPVGAVQEDPEDVSADASAFIRLAHPAADQLAQSGEHLIARGDAEGLVDVLEVVYPERDHRAAVAVARGVVDVSRQGVLKADPVEEAREGITLGLLEKPCLLALALADVVSDDRDAANRSDQHLAERELHRHAGAVRLMRHDLPPLLWRRQLVPLIKPVAAVCEYSSANGSASSVGKVVPARSSIASPKRRSAAAFA